MKMLSYKQLKMDTTIWSVTGRAGKTEFYRMHYRCIV